MLRQKRLDLVRLLLLLLCLPFAAQAQRFVKVVNTISDLVLLNPNDVHTNVFVADPARGGLFSLATRTTTNTGTILMSTNATKQWNRQYQGALNVKWFNAKGDAATDDHTSISNAISAATDGDTILFPNGTYRVNGTIAVTKRLFVTGEAVTIQAVGVRTNLIWVSAAGAKIDGFKLLSDEDAGDWGDGSLALTRVGLEVGSAAQNVTVSGVIANDFSTGFRANGSVGTVFLNCLATNTWLTTGQTSYNNSSGLQANGSEGTAVFNWKSDGYGQGILSLSTSKRGAIVGVDIRRSIDNGIYGSSGESWTGSGIRVTNAGQVGLKFRGRMNQFSDVVVDGAGTLGVDLTAFAAGPTAGSEDAIYSTNRGLAATSVRYNGHGNKLSGFVVKNTGSGGVRLGTASGDGFTVYQHDSSISHGTCINTATNDQTHVILFGGDGTTIEDVSILNWNLHSDSTAIVVSAPTGVLFDRVRIVGNKIAYLGGTNAATGISINGLTNSAVQGNIVANTTNSISLAGSHTIKFDDNIGQGNFRIAGSKSTNIVASANWFAGAVAVVTGVEPVTSRFVHNVASSWPTDRVNVYLFNANPSPADWAYSMRYDQTNENFSIGTDPIATSRTPFLVRRDQASDTTIGVQNSTAGGSAIYEFTVGSASASIGLYDITHATTRYRDRGVWTANSTASGLDLDLITAAQDFRLNYAGERRFNIDFDSLNLASTNRIQWSTTSSSDGAAGLSLTSGAATPESNVTANTGDRYFARDGTAWLKATGTGSTGWQQIQESTSSGALMPTGTVIAFAGASPPAGYLSCDGSAVSRTTYAALFAVISTTWGVGDGVTTFNVPDLRGRQLIGSGTGAGLTARTLGTQNIGAETVTLSTANMPVLEPNSTILPAMAGATPPYKLHASQWDGIGPAYSMDGTDEVNPRGGSEGSPPAQTAVAIMDPSGVVTFIIKD